MTRTISRDDIQTRLAEGNATTLVEALPLKYFEAEHLPGAVNINFDEVEALAPKVLPDKTAFIVVYCANNACQNSTKAAHQLESLGYTNVHVYVDGKQDWIEAGMAVSGTRMVA